LAFLALIQAAVLVGMGLAPPSVSDCTKCNR